MKNLERINGDTTRLKIAVTSQNRNAVTANAESCHRFWVYDVELQYQSNAEACVSFVVLSKVLHEYDKNDCFKNSGQLPKELNNIHLFITAGIELHFKDWLAKQFIGCEVVTNQTAVPVDTVVKHILRLELHSND